jgi:hypothetical protein
MPESTTNLNLALDHCGCIVNDLDAGAARWERLGFNLTPLSRQRGAVPGREGFHPWATANRCAILGNTYLELIGVVDPAAYNPWAKFISKNEGLHILARRCEEADSAHAALSSRTDALLPPVPRERVLDVDGEARTMRFRNIFSRDDKGPEARYLVIEHETPEFVWQPRHQAHENGATDLAAVTFVADDPTTLLLRMQALGATEYLKHSGGVSANLPGGGTLHVMLTDAYAEAYGYAPQPRSGMHAITVRFRALPRALDLLAKRGVTVTSSPTGHWIHPRDTNGFVMHLIEAGQIS